MGERPAQLAEHGIDDLVVRLPGGKRQAASLEIAAEINAGQTEQGGSEAQGQDSPGYGPGQSVRWSDPGHRRRAVYVIDMGGIPMTFGIGNR